MIRPDSLPADPPETDTPRQKRPRGRYRVTASGSTALEGYKKTVSAAQASAGGRQALEECQASWASSHGLLSRDALVLDELATKPQAVVELGRSLDDCGMDRPDIESGIDRLSAAGLIELVPARVVEEPPPHPRY